MVVMQHFYFRIQLLRLVVQELESTTVRVPSVYCNLSTYLKCTGVLKVYWNVLEFGVRRSLVVMFAAIRLQFKPWPGQKFETRFLLRAHPCSASGTTTLVTRASPTLGNSPKK